MAEKRNKFSMILMAGFILSMVMPVSGASAQENANSGIFSGLFNQGTTSTAKPLYVKPKTAQPTGNSTYKGGSASRTGVATPSPYAGSNNSMNYRTVSEDQMEKMTTSEIIQMETDAQMSSAHAFREQKVKEAEEMAKLYRAQMEERLAAQLANPSALQSMGAGGTGGVNEEAIRRKMVYKPGEAETTGKKPIRLFDVR